MAMEVLPEHEGPAMPIQNGGLDLVDTAKDLTAKIAMDATENLPRSHGDTEKSKCRHRFAQISADKFQARISAKSTKKPKPRKNQTAKKTNPQGLSGSPLRGHP